MSYDFRIIEVSDDVKCPTCGHERELFYYDLGSPTYNIGGIFRAATGGRFKQGVPVPIREALTMWTDALLAMHDGAREAEFRAMEPENGWGTLEGARGAAGRVVRACSEIIETGGADAPDGRRISIDNLYFKA